MTTWLEEFPLHLVKRPGRLEFTLNNTDEDDNLVFTPHFMRYKERYGIYFMLFHEDSEEYKAHCWEEERKHLLELDTIDLLPVGNDQYELKHEVGGEKTFADTSNGYKFRGAEPNAYRCKQPGVRVINACAGRALCQRYYKAERSKRFRHFYTYCRCLHFHFYQRTCFR